MLDVQNLTVQYGRHTVVQNISFQVRPGQKWMLIGPNGAGKTSIVKAIAQSVPYKGSILFEKQNIARLKPARLARCLGVLEQTHSVGYAFTVEEVVRLGRYAYSKGFLQQSTPQDEPQVEAALRATGMLDLRSRPLPALSGGEVQRTFLAQLLAQDPKLLILDEPANHLDLFYQKQLFELIDTWLADGTRAVVSVVHDLNLAKAYGTHALLLDDSTQVAQGAISQVLTPQNLQAVYSVDVYAWMHAMLAQWEK